VATMPFREMTIERACPRSCASVGRPATNPTNSKNTAVRILTSGLKVWLFIAKTFSPGRLCNVTRFEFDGLERDNIKFRVGAESKDEEIASNHSAIAFGGIMSVYAEDMREAVSLLGEQ
jgi:hypothetical protein